MWNDSVFFLYIIWFSPNMANTVNAALKPLETLSRIVNQPSSLFGGKGGSSKNKAEHDNVGTTRDSNSNTQDQGIDMSQTLLLDTVGHPPYVYWYCIADIWHLFQESLARLSQWRATTGCRGQTAIWWMERRRETQWLLLVNQRFSAHRLCRWLRFWYTTY